jgi:hypothetical protein
VTDTQHLADQLAAITANLAAYIEQRAEEIAAPRIAAARAADQEAIDNLSHDLKVEQEIREAVTAELHRHVASLEKQRDRAAAKARPAATADEIAALLRSTAAARREYMKNVPVVALTTATGLELECSTLETAADIAEGQAGPLYSLLPSWKWTEEMHAALSAGKVGR